MYLPVGCKGIPYREAMIGIALYVIVMIGIITLAIHESNKWNSKNSLPPQQSKANPAKIHCGSLPHKEVALKLDFYVPFHQTEATFIVNHGNGWWYAPYTGEKLFRALEIFEQARPMLTRNGFLQDIAARSRHEYTLPLDKYDYNPKKGTFIHYSLN